MRLKLGPCPSCPEGDLTLLYDGDTVCDCCSYRERAPNVRRVTLRSFTSRNARSGTGSG